MDNTTLSAENIRTSLDRIRTDIRQVQKAIAVEKSPSPHELQQQLSQWEMSLRGVESELQFIKSAQVNLLYEVSTNLSAATDWRGTLQAVLDAIINISGAERGMLLLLSGDGTIEIELIRTAVGSPPSEQEIQFSKSVVTKSLDKGEPILASNALTDPRFTGAESIIAYEMRSILCAPLIFRDEPIGAIYIDNQAKSSVFDKEDLAVLASLAKQASTAIYNAQVHRKKDRELSERVRQLTILQEMVHDLNENLRYDRVMERSISWAMAAAGAEHGAIALFAEEGLRWVASVGQVQPDTALTLRAIRYHSPLLDAPRLVLPLFREHRPIGAIYLLTPINSFDEPKLDFVQRVADNAAIAVENARLYEALRQANQAKSEFVSVVSHELRTPMTAINGYAGMLEKGMAGELNDQQKEFLLTIQRNVQRMRILVSDLLDISRIETGRVKITPIELSLDDAIPEALSAVQAQAERKAQLLEIDLDHDLPRVIADQDRLGQILINLLSNAVKYSPEGGTIVIGAAPTDPRYDPDGTTVTCYVRDNGYGISPSDQVKLFTKFFRADNDNIREQPGTGLGLVITKSLIEIQGGRIWFESAESEGTTFYFTLPVAQ